MTEAKIVANRMIVQAPGDVDRPATRVYLETINCGAIVLKCKDATGRIWFIAELSSNGLELYEGIRGQADVLGFPIDTDGRIQIVK